MSAAACIFISHFILDLPASPGSLAYWWGWDPYVNVSPFCWTVARQVNLGVPDGTAPGSHGLAYMAQGVGVALVINEHGLISLGAGIQDLKRRVRYTSMVIFFNLPEGHLILAHLIWNRNRREVQSIQLGVDVIKQGTGSAGRDLAADSDLASLFFRC